MKNRETLSFNSTFIESHATSEFNSSFIQKHLLVLFSQGYIMKSVQILIVFTLSSLINLTVVNTYT